MEQHSQLTQWSLQLSDLTISDGSVEEEPNSPNDLISLSEQYGPKRVKTPNMEVGQFSPLEMQRIRDRESAIYPTLEGMHITIASPDHCKYYPTHKSR